MVSVGVSGYGKFILVLVEGWGVGARSGATCLKIFYMANGGRITNPPLT